MNWCFISLIVQKIQSRIIFSAFRLCEIKEKSIPNVGGYCKYACVSTDEAYINLCFSVEGCINIWNVSILWTKILLLGIYPKNVIMNMCKDLAIVMFTRILLSLKIVKQSKCPEIIVE